MPYELRRSIYAVFLKRFEGGESTILVNGDAFMKYKKKWLLIISICVIVFGAFGTLWANRPLFMNSVSPNEEYQVTIYTRSGVGLLNVPEYLTIVVKENRFLSSKVKIYTHIDNDDTPISPNQNVHIFWDEAQLTIVLLGEEQLPEIIEVFLDEKISYQSHQLELPQGSAETILREHGVDLAALSPYLYLNPQTEG